MRVKIYNCFSVASARGFLVIRTIFMKELWMDSVKLRMEVCGWWEEEKRKFLMPLPRII